MITVTFEIDTEERSVETTIDGERVGRNSYCDGNCNGEGVCNCHGLWNDWGEGISLRLLDELLLHYSPPQPEE